MDPGAWQLVPRYEPYKTGEADRDKRIRTADRCDQYSESSEFRCSASSEFDHKFHELRSHHHGNRRALICYQYSYEFLLTDVSLLLLKFFSDSHCSHPKSACPDSKQLWELLASFDFVALVALVVI